MGFRRFVLAAAAALVVGFAGTASASVMIEANVTEMTREADVVAKGKVTTTESKVSRDGKRIFTVVTLRVDEAWKGAPGKTLQIQVPGGTHGGIGQVVHGAPRFTEGEEVVVFLRAPVRGAEVQAPTLPLRVVAMAQGKLRVERNAEGNEVAAPDLSGLELIEPGTTEPVPATKVAPVQLQILEQQVKKAALP
ncbi:hypothetical protein [Vulgatibacter sp.]|uniref:hypothetical protein n=1 Tax=Vulgatibacter sp. TaxID=1971226 RepID=UPI00356A62F6